MATEAEGAQEPGRRAHAHPSTPGKLLTFRVSRLLISLFSSCSSCSFRAERNIEGACHFCQRCHTQVHPLSL